MLQKALSAKPSVEMHHEYAVQITQPLAVKRYLGLLDDGETQKHLRETFGAAGLPGLVLVTGGNAIAVPWPQSAARPPPVPAALQTVDTAGSLAPALRNATRNWLARSCGNVTRTMPNWW